MWRVFCGASLLVSLFSVSVVALVCGVSCCAFPLVFVVGVSCWCALFWHCLLACLRWRSFVVFFVVLSSVALRCASCVWRCFLRCRLDGLSPLACFRSLRYGCVGGGNVVVADDDVLGVILKTVTPTLKRATALCELQRHKRPAATAQARP